MALSRRNFLTLVSTSAATAIMVSPLDAFYARVARGQSTHGRGHGSLKPQLPENISELPADSQTHLLELPKGLSSCTSVRTGETPIPQERDFSCG